METTKTLQTKAKTVPAKTYLCHTQKTTLAKMMEKIGEQVDDLYQAVAKHGLEKAGAIEFIYLDCNGKQDDPFVLKIAIPVKATAIVNDETFKLEETSEFKCLAYMHKGDITEIGGVYESLYGTILGQGVKPTNQVREVYEKFVSLHSPDNSTEIQIGVM